MDDSTHPFQTFDQYAAVSQARDICFLAKFVITNILRRTCRFRCVVIVKDCSYLLLHFDLTQLLYGNKVCSILRVKIILFSASLQVSAVCFNVSFSHTEYLSFCQMWIFAEALWNPILEYMVWKFCSVTSNCVPAMRQDTYFEEAYSNY